MPAAIQAATTIAPVRSSEASSEPSDDAGGQAPADPAPRVLRLAQPDHERRQQRPERGCRRSAPCRPATCRTAAARARSRSRAPPGRSSGRTAAISAKLATSTSPSQTSGKPRGPPSARIHVITAAARTPAATGYDHELIAYSMPTARPAASASGDRAPEQVAARAAQRHLHRERQREHGERQRQHVRVQVAEQERERRELVDRVRDHPRRVEPGVVVGRVVGADPRPDAREVAEDRHQRRGDQPGEHRPAARRARPAPRAPRPTACPRTRRPRSPSGRSARPRPAGSRRPARARAARSATPGPRGRGSSSSATRRSSTGRAAGSARTR